MPALSSVDNSVVPVRHTIGNPTLETDVSALPYLSNKGLTKSKSRTVPRNPSFSKKNWQKNHKERVKPEHLDRSIEFADDTQPTKCPVLELTLIGGHSPDSQLKGIKADTGRNYLENHKAVLKQRGMRYQEIFGYTPRKWDKTYGQTSSQTPVLVSPLAKSLGSSDGQYRLKATQGSPVFFPNSKLPDITDSEPLSHGNVHYNTTGSDILDFKPKAFSDTEDEDKFAEVLSSSGFTPRRVRKRGKLGGIMTQKQMEDLLETNEPLRMQNYYNMYE